MNTNVEQPKTDRNNDMMQDLIQSEVVAAAKAAGVAQPEKMVKHLRVEARPNLDTGQHSFVAISENGTPMSVAGAIERMRETHPKLFKPNDFIPLKTPPVDISEASGMTHEQYRVWRKANMRTRKPGDR